MPSDRSREALLDIRDNIEFARGFIEGLDLAAFEADRRTLYAVMRCLEIISEASRRLSPEVKARLAHIPWRAIADLGNAYRHAYHGLRPEAVWLTARESLPPLLAAVEAEIARG